MKINNKVLSIPPYLSTAWSSIQSLHMRGTDLVVNLKDGNKVEIPELDTKVLMDIFNTHAEVLEGGAQGVKEASLPTPPFAQMFSSNVVPNAADQRAEFPFRFAVSSSLEDTGMLLQHDPAQALSPDIPGEILNKIVAITQIISPEDRAQFPKAEDNCNCVHCQISRAFHQSGLQEQSQILAIETKEEEVVADSELAFQQWDIAQAGPDMYTVISRLDPSEKYTVFLGNPVGCNCGQTNCEHIVAVLKS